MKRKEGYYWVNFSIDRIGYWSERLNCWLLCGIDIEVKDENVEVLSKEIKFSAKNK